MMKVAQEVTTQVIPSISTEESDSVSTGEMRQTDIISEIVPNTKTDKSSLFVGQLNFRKEIIPVINKNTLNLEDECEENQDNIEGEIAPPEIKLFPAREQDKEMFHSASEVLPNIKSEVVVPETEGDSILTQASIETVWIKQEAKDENETLYDESNEDNSDPRIFCTNNAMLRRQILKYKPQQMDKAMQAVKDGMSIKKAAERHGVPRNTLSDKVKGKTPQGRKMGPESWLTAKEESVLVKWALSLRKAGFPITMEDLKNNVQQLTTELKRPFPFKDGRPGRKWCAAFLKRNPDLTLRTLQNLTSSRATVSQENIRNWFKKIHKFLEKNGLENVLLDPRRIFNGDEAAFYLNPKRSKVLARKGDRSIYQLVNSEEKECLTVFLTGNAAGDLCPPLVCCKCERLPQDIVANMPREWGVGKSPNGWMTGEVFYEFLSTIFHPWLVEKNIPLPVILFIDGNSSHLTLHTSKFCEEHGIVLVALFPNATHIIQPIDVGVFKPLKTGWKTAVHEWRIGRVASKENPTLKKKDFARLLKTAIEKTVTVENLQHSFRKCGIFPWNLSAVDKQKPVPKSRGESIPVPTYSVTPQKPKICRVLEEFLGKDKLGCFEASEDVWHGDVKDTSLFEFWKYINTPKPATDSSNDHPEVPEMQHTTESTSIPSTSAEEDLPTVSLDPVPCSYTDLSKKTTTAVEDGSTVFPNLLPSSSSLKPPSTPTRLSMTPSPFKQPLFQPSEKPKIKKLLLRGKAPSVARYKAGQDYFLRKEAVKIEMHKKREERAAKRIRKKKKSL